MLTGDFQLVQRERKLRKDMSLPEGLLWRALRTRPTGIKFRKQHPAGFYVLDFFCAKAKLCVEIDGEAHNRGDQPEFDGKRDAWLRLHDIETLRIPAIQVLNDLEGVLAYILDAAGARLPLHHPAGGPPPHSWEELH